jgi:poly-gamma-glutamate synthesis protein (capsule biosynthesis protein)
MQPAPTQPSSDVTLFLCGDVMTGRGVDQILRHPSAPHLFEPYMRSAVGYVKLAEAASGAIPRRVDPRYIWGDALPELERRRPRARVVNLETAVTVSEDVWPGKGIQYRMHPANVGCLTAAGIDCCVLANNHVLDWGHAGLAETLDTLHEAGLRTAGAGRDAAQAAQPAAIDLGYGGRLLVFAFGCENAGVPSAWAAGDHRAGVNLLPELSDRAVRHLAGQVAAAKRAGDVVVASLHWGDNWSYRIPPEHRDFAHRLIDEAAVDLIHGHSSHHPVGIEVYRGKLVLYGCGDFLNDYEGIRRYDSFRSDLGLMYFPTLDPAGGRLLRLEMTPMQIRRFRVNHAPHEARDWLRDRLHAECRPLGTGLAAGADDGLVLCWSGSGD